MARYGAGNEDMKAAAAEMAALRAEREGLVSREAQVRAEIQSTSGAIRESEQAEVRRTEVRREAESVARRRANVSDVEARTTRASTRAIEDNTRARERNARIRREASQVSEEARRRAQVIEGNVLQGPIQRGSPGLPAGTRPLSPQAIRALESLPASMRSAAFVVMNERMRSVAGALGASDPNNRTIHLSPTMRDPTLKYGAPDRGVPTDVQTMRAILSHEVFHAQSARELPARELESVGKRIEGMAKAITARIAPTGDPEAMKAWVRGSTNAQRQVAEAGHPIAGPQLRELYSKRGMPFYGDRARYPSEEIGARVSAFATVHPQDFARAVGQENARWFRGIMERGWSARDEIYKRERQAETVQGRAVRGARDPLFEQASIRGLRSQYALRRELGIGQARAAAIQAAVVGGFRPGVPGADRPVTRFRAAEEALAQADADLAQAKRDYTNITRRKTATDQERLEAFDNRTTAADRRRAALAELDSARTNQASVNERVAARQRITQTEERAASVSGNALVPRTPQNAGYRTAAELRAAAPGPQFGQYPYAPIGREQVRGLGEIERPVSPEVVGLRAGERNMNAHAAAARILRDRAAATADLAEKEQMLARALTAEERAMHDQAYAQGARATDQMGAAMDRSRRATRLAAVEFGTASQAMRRHGALTSEFIAAAARGETTLRELGFQTVATAGKFAGWTAAATAIYGAVGAVSRLGEGAMQASGGVHQLERVIQGVDPAQAQGAFRALADEFNVPIATAADAVYRMGQRFHSVPEAVEAARASLYSFKTGEVDVGTSTENLIAIVNGFGLSADQLSSVYDQINQAQNVFGIRIGDTEAGLAKAAGTFRNAGGDLNFLLALMTAIGRATNRSGTEIGTGISRAAVRIREAKSAELLRSQGVTPTPDNLQQTIQNAMAAARNGADVQTLSQGIFGNQYARLLTAVLKDQTVFNQALSDTSPEAAKGSAQRELGRVLRQVDEQIQRVGVGLERLGSALAESGAFDFLGVLLSGLNGVLGVATRLVEMFDALPDGLQQGAIYAAQIAGALALMRRFGPSRLAERFPELSGIVSDPNRQLQLRATRGMRDQLGAVQNARERLLGRQVQQQIELETKRRNLSVFDRDVVTPGRAAYPKYSKERLLLELQRGAMEEQLRTAEARSTATSRELVQLEKLDLTAQQELQRVRTMKATEVRAYLAANNIPIPAGLDTPSAHGATFVPRGAAPPPPPAPLPVSRATRGPGFESWRYSAGETVASTRRAAQFQTFATRQLDQARLGMALWGQSNSTMVRAMDRFATGGISRSTRALTGIEGALTRLRSAPGRVTTMIGNVVRGLGVLDGLFLAFIGFDIIRSKINESQEKLDQSLKGLRHTPRGADAQQHYIDQSRKAQRNLEGMDLFGSPVYGNVGDLLHDAAYAPIKAVSTIGNKLLPGDPLPNRDLNINIKREQAERLKENRERIEADRAAVAQSRANLYGRTAVAPNSTRQEITRFAKESARDARDGVISIAQFRDEIAARVDELNRSVYVGPKNRRIGVAALNRLRRATLVQASPRDLISELRGATDDELTQYQTYFQSQLQSGGNSRTARTARGQGRRGLAGVLRQQMARQGDAQSIEELNQDRQSIQDAIDAFGSGVDHLQQQLDAATSPAGRRRVVRQARRTARGPQRAAQGVVDADKKRVAALNEELGHVNIQLNAAERGIAGTLIEGPLGQLPFHRTTPGENRQHIETMRQRFRDTLNRLKAAKRRLGLDTETLNQAIESARENLRQIAETAYQDREADIDAGSALRSSRLAPDDTVGRAREDESAARLKLGAAKGYRGPGRVDKLREARTNLNNAVNSTIQAEAEDAIAGIRAQGSINEARAGAAGDPVAAARAALNTAIQVRDALKAKGGNDYKEAIAAVIQARTTLNQAIQDYATTIAGLKFDIQSALAEGDPVAQAHIAQARANDMAARAKTDEQRLSAQLQQIQANNQLEESVADREQARYEYLMSMTADPVKRDRLQLKADNAAIKTTKPGTAERYRAMAKRNNDRRQLVQDQASSRMEDIDFNLEMEKISTDVAIRQYRSLLKMHNLTKETKRQILRKIKQLQEGDSGELSLTPGDIKLPTRTELARFIGGGGSYNRATVNHNNRNTVIVNVAKPGDADKVYDALEMAGISGVKTKARTTRLG